MKSWSIEFIPFKSELLIWVECFSPNILVRCTFLKRYVVGVPIQVQIISIVIIIMDFNFGLLFPVVRNRQIHSCLISIISERLSALRKQISHYIKSISSGNRDIFISRSVINPILTNKL